MLAHKGLKRFPCKWPSCPNYYDDRHSYIQHFKSHSRVNKKESDQAKSDLNSVPFKIEGNDLNNRDESTTSMK